MSGRIDVDAIRSAVAISEVIGRYVELRKAGAEFKGLCPFHEERTPSFSVNDAKGIFRCFGCNAGGDVIDFIMKREGLEFRAAAEMVARMAHVPLDGSAPPARPVARKAARSDPDKTPIMPVPPEAPAPTFRHPRLGTPSRTWEYRDGEGRLLGYVCRFDSETGKDVLPYSYTPSGWRWVAFAKPRPLYGLPELTARPGASVVVVEGEKARDAAAELFPHAAVVTWAGGGKAVKHADWEPLRGRKVVIWPDQDLQHYREGHPRAGELIPPMEQPGMLTAIEIAERLGALDCQVRIAIPPPREVNGWDAYDAVAEGWTHAEAISWLRSSLRELAEIKAEAERETAEARQTELQRWEGPSLVQAEPPHEEPQMHFEPPPDFDGADEGGDPFEGAPFQALGYDHGVFYYLSRGAKQVLALTGSGHTKGNLLMLAPLSYWEREFPKKGGADWDMAANALLRLSERAGVYDPMRVRGRGAWWDAEQKQAVLHLGDRLVAGGAEHDVARYRSRYIYEAAAPLRLNTARPLAAAEAIELLNLCRLLSWEKQIHATLLAGWCVVAPICGALRWRPHIWITGPAGSGKSWVYENILVRSLGEIALAAASETTEAGLRQVLGMDARPVVFDEAEGENARAQSRIQNVLALMRQASSETSAAIYKGTATGDGQRFITRSCFAFSSIGVGLQQHADQTRVTVLPLRVDPTLTREERSRHFSEILEPKWLETLTPEFVDRLHARTISLVPVIRRNAETFAVAGASVIGTRRLGDQLGALIAGAYSLHSSREISLDEAREWLARQDWTDEAALQEQRDEVACLQQILQHVVPVQTDRGRLDRSLGELVLRLHRGATSDAAVDSDTARATLKRWGLRVDDGETLLVANNHTAIRKVLADTPWSRNWRLILRRLPDAYMAPPTRFSGVIDRAVAIPLAGILGGAAGEQQSMPGFAAG